MDSKSNARYICKLHNFYSDDYYEWEEHWVRFHHGEF